jgi:predicted nucleic acid-binding Zn ribbon protein
MDIIDKAQESIEKEDAARFAARRFVPLQHTGECHNCGDAVDANRVFCDATCRDDFDKRRRLNLITGAHRSTGSGH